MDNSMMDKKGGVCGCIHHKMLPILTILFGLAFLLLRLNILVNEDFVNLAWPILVIAAGATKLGEGKCKCC